jgi:hypothetical protein
VRKDSKEPAATSKISCARSVPTKYLTQNRLVPLITPLWPPRIATLTRGHAHRYTQHTTRTTYNTHPHTHTPTHIVRITIVVIIIVIVVHPSAISSPRISCPADIDDFRVGPARILKQAPHGRRRPARPGPYLGATCPPNLWARPLRPPNSTACRRTNGLRFRSVD